MSEFIIYGKQALSGTITASGNKNAALPMIAASILTEEEVVLTNVPNILDVRSMIEILDHLGVDTNFQDNTLRICAHTIKTYSIPPHLCEKTRTSFLFVGPLLYRCQRANVHPPGGDVIGRRRLDAHFYGLQRLGVICDTDTFQFSIPNQLRSADLFLDETSVTATEHLLMLCCLTPGKSTILNSASEPHVQELALFLKAMGADISGIGTNNLAINGVEKLSGAHQAIQSDYIEVGSYLALAAATGGSIRIENVVRSHYWMIRRVFERFNIFFEFQDNAIYLPGGQDLRVQADAGEQTPKVDDGPWPSFPSDMMSPMIILATQAQGSVLFFEKQFESRLYFVDPLKQMGANIIVCDPHRIIVMGKSELHGQTVRSPDIRAGMALIIAALCANHRPSRIQNAEEIDRGYENIETKLKMLNAKIERVN